MKVVLNRKNDAFHFEGLGLSNVGVPIDASEDVGGVNAGARPMELLLMGLGSCSAIDVLIILKKQRQLVEDVSIEIEGDRVSIPDTHMSPFRKINVHFILKGQLEESKVAKAIEMSMQKYCSATAQLSCSSEITHSFQIL